MKRIALLFPGQGVDLALAPLLVTGAPRVRATIERAAPELLDLLQRGGPKLARTEILQPAVTALCLGVVSEGVGVMPEGLRRFEMFGAIMFHGGSGLRVDDWGNKSLVPPSPCGPKAAGWVAWRGV